MPKTTLPALHEKKRRPRKKPAYDAHVDRVQALADQLYAEVARETFASLTFEEKQDAIASGLRKAGARMEERALRESLTNAELIEVDGVAYRRLKQCSGATYFGMWGVHRIDESLYREVGVHNGRTIKPLERAAGIVTKTMTPMLARTLGEMQARMTSREATAQLQRLGLGSGERAYAADHVHMLEQEIADDIVELERAARAQEKIPKGVASISLGMDRRSVPMEEARPADQPPKTERRPRRKPYVRKRPAPIDVNYRMAYVGTVCTSSRRDLVCRSRSCRTAPRSSTCFPKRFAAGRPPTHRSTSARIFTISSGTSTPWSQRASLPAIRRTCAHGTGRSCSATTAASTRSLPACVAGRRRSPRPPRT